MSEQRRYDDELDLLDYVNIVLKRKKLVLTVCLGAVLAAAIATAFMPRVFRATALVLIAPSKVDTFLDAASQFPSDMAADAKKGGTINQGFAIALPTHKMLLTSSIVLERVIKKLNLATADGKPIQVDDLLKKVSIKEEAQTSIFQLSAQDNSPVTAMNLANAWAQEYIHYSEELISGEIKGSGDFVIDQFLLTKKKLYDAEQKMAAFKDQYKFDLVQAELEMKKNKINDYKKDLLNMEVAIKTEEDLLKELKSQIAGQDPLIITAKAITDDALWQQGSRAEFDKQKLRSESVNPIYQDLKINIIKTETELNTNRSKIDFLRPLITATNKDINELEKTLGQKRIELSQLARDVETYRRSYDKLSGKLEEARMAKTVQLLEVKLVSPAYPPNRPVSPNKLRNVTKAAVLGLIAGIFLALAKEWLGKRPGLRG